MRRLTRAVLVAGLALLPGTSHAFVFEEWIECSALLDVLDVSQTDQPQAMRMKLDEVADVFADRFGGVHGIAAAKQLRQYHRDLWQSKPISDETSLALAKSLTFCEKEARRIGHPIVLPDPE